MWYLQMILRLSLLTISCYGYLQMISKRIRPEFAIGILFSGILSVLFFGGLLNVLSECAWIICFAGLALAVRSVWKKESVKNVLTPGVIAFLVMAFLFALLLYGRSFAHYDNFSHWALASQKLIQYDRFPNQTDSVFYFQSYPVGSACFIYYFAEIIGNPSEWIQMWAQALLMAGFAVSLFAFANKVFQYVVITLGVLFLLSANMDFVDLLVDTLLPVMALHGFALITYYRKETGKNLLWITPTLAALVAVKNSGLLFALLLPICILILKTDKGNKRFWITWPGLLAAPLVTKHLWDRHVDMLFVKGAVSKHAFSFENYKNVFEEKSSEDIENVIDAFFARVFSLDNTDIYMLIALAVLIAFWIAFRKTSRPKIGRILAIAIGSYLIYQIGLLCMFLFSMPTGEALALGGYGRYQQTIRIFIGGILLIAAMGVEFPKQIGKSLPVYAGIVVFSWMLYLFLNPVLSYYKRNPGNPDRERLQHLIETHQIEKGKSYTFLYQPKNNSDDYFNFVAGYALESTSVVIVSPYGEINDDWKTDYVIMIHETDDGWNCLKESFGENAQVVNRCKP